MKTVTVTHKEFETNHVTMTVEAWEAQADSIKEHYTAVYN